jgi:ABC-2 type transport system ATP-binding protein
MIQLEHVTKKFGNNVAVNDLSFTVAPGVVTGFLGPNGSGKSTTMRMILGLDSPTKGTAIVNGKPYRQIQRPLREVGALLDAKAVHPGRSARNHLLAMAASNKIPASRVDEVLRLTGIDGVAKRKAGDFSLGMSQRLGIAGALLGDPHTLLFDEPVNGLDPEGIRWVREFFQSLAHEGRTVLVSSHLMSEMSLMATNIIVIGKGALITQGSIDDIISAEGGGTVSVRSPRLADLIATLSAHGAHVVSSDADTASLSGITAETIGDLALTAGIALYELATHRITLEDAFMDLTRSSAEYTTSNEKSSS